MRMVDVREHIAAFVREMEGKGCLEPGWLREALYNVPRHLFIEQYYEMEGGKHLVTVDRAHPTERDLNAIYSDRGLMIREPPNHSAASQPSLVLMMLRYLEVEESHRVLEIGTGSGWNAGLLAFRADDDRLVHSIDLQTDLVERARDHLCAAGFPGVNLRAGDGGYGWPDGAPFDRITATVGCPDVPPAWREQLAEGGIVLIPLKAGGVGDPLLRLKKRHNCLGGQFVGYSGFMTLQGAFWTDAEDLLFPPWDPRIEELLNVEPTEIAVAEPIDIDCLFFLHLEGMRFHALIDEQSKLGWPRRVLYCPEWNAIFSPGRKEPAVEIYGDTDIGEALTAASRKWIELGRPKLTDYRVELTDTCSSGVAEGWWVRRPNAVLGLSL